MTDGAQFWAVDLHTHTPASRDVRAVTYGGNTPEDFVAAALAAGLDAVAITDHNTSAWCESVAAAAAATDRVVLPGVEISTNEGHLLAIWEDGTPCTAVDELLVRLGIGKEDQGKLDIAADVSFAEAAKQVAAAGGLAIAAHIDRQRGVLKLEVAAHRKRTLREPALAAVEIADLATAALVESQVGTDRVLACIRSSDVTMPGQSVHVLAGVGSRRTWIKASRPDLIGVRHAVADPELRIALEDPSVAGSHKFVESVAFTGGFLDGQMIPMSPDLTCLLGGTGAGKSLVLEAVRYALDQQVDRARFPSIRQEVDSRLGFAMGNSGSVRVTCVVEGERYAIERAYSTESDGVSTVFQEVEGDWTEISSEPADLIAINAFSQGEALEYSREPVGRMSLVDAGVDFGDLPQLLDEAMTKLQTNATRLLAQRRRVADLTVAIAEEGDITERVSELSALFDKDIVKQQESWKTEDTNLKSGQRTIPSTDSFDLKVPTFEAEASVTGNEGLFEEARKVVSDLDASILKSTGEIHAAVATAREKLDLVRTQWQGRFDLFKATLDDELNKVGEGSSLVALRAQLEKLQGRLVDVRAKKAELEATEQPKLVALTEERETLLEELQVLRVRRRQLRRDRTETLNSKTAGIVKLDIPSEPDSAAFRACLATLKTGSRVRDEVLQVIAQRVHPFRFVRAFLRGDLNEIVDDKLGIDTGSVARLFANLDDRDLWKQLLDAQICEMSDRLNVKFRKPDDGTYVPIEQLAHGQRCTAILVILLADGDAPVIVDQPEDALHAPWIEEYLVDRLRGLRGERQYIFATRSPGIVVGADAEQIVTMKATAGRGEIEATGSLERHDLNKLALHHLEGGRVPFQRRSKKLAVSVEPAKPAR
jgi:hypothetical protein